MPGTKNESDKTRFVIPPALVKYFVEHPRVVIKPAPGLIPIDLAVFRKEIQTLQKLTADKEFADNYEIVIMPIVR
jgi:hypothetical protein